MRHEHLVVTVEAGRKERIDANLDAGESLEAWVADAIEQKLARQAEDDADGPGPDDSDLAGSGPADSESGPADSDSEYADIIDLGEADGDESRGGESSDADDSRSSTIDPGERADDDYDEGFEYVDDCAI